jgi:hypothetical protein
MTTKGLDIWDGRTVLVCSAQELRKRVFDEPFAILLPAFNPVELEQSEQLVSFLLDQGCVQFCCVGPDSELLHDNIDMLIVIYSIEHDRNDLGILTVWDTDSSEGAWNFLFLTGAVDLVALLDAHPDLIKELEAV